MSLESVFPGPSAMAALMRERDWSRSPLGPPQDWSPTLRNATRICLTSRFPMIVWWGPELRFIYNDDYLPLLGSKHPALDLPGEQVWGEIWHIIGPMLQGVLSTGEPTWSENLLLPMDRHGYWEETYWTYSYSPLYDNEGTVRGVFTAVTDSTEQVIGARRLAILQDLGAEASTAHTVEQACGLAAQALGRAQADVPYFAVYLRESAGEDRLRLASGTPGTTAHRDRWPLAEVLASGKAVTLRDLAGQAGPLPAGGWRDPPTEAMVLPLPAAAGHEASGALVLAASAGHQLDEGYRTFMELVARQTAALINGAEAYRVQQRRAEDLTELDRVKTAFFANVSHEFRTPLTLMMGPVQDLRDRLSSTDAAARDELDVVYRNGLRLGKLVNTLLDFAQIEAGRMQARYEPVDLATFTAELASAFRSAFYQAGLDYQVSCPPLGQPVWVDRDMWEKVVLNLVSNALKYTFRGSVQVGLAAEDGQAVLRVHDTGVGIPPDQLPLLFERFQRGHDARARSHEGSGIGLALVKELVELHAGTVDVASTPAGGSTFTVRLPLGHAHLPAGSVVTAEPSVAPARPTAGPAGTEPFVTEAMRWFPERDEQPDADLPGADHDERARNGDAPVAASVLVADDNADMRNYLRRLLQPQYRVTTVADGRAALAAAQAAAPDLIVSDVMMPGLDGLSLAHALRADPRTAAVPLLLLSARAGTEAAVEGLEAGADDYLVKPFGARELLARVRASVALTRLRGAHTRWRSALTESLQEGFFVTDADGALVEVNPAFRHILGYGEEAFRAGVARPWWPDPETDPEDHRRVAAALEATRTKPSGRFEVPLRRQDGARIWAVITFNAVEDPEGHGRILVGTIRDVTAGRLAADREAAVAAMTARLSGTATPEGVLAAGLAELRGHWSATRALAAVWSDSGTMTLASAPPGLEWDDLPPGLRQAIEMLRDQPPLHPTTTSQPVGAGTAVEYAGNRAAVWLDLDGRPAFGLEDRTRLALLCASLGQALNRSHLLGQHRDVALTLQRVMLGPTAMPPGFAARYEPATPPLEVGGDWYDVIELDGDRVGIVVGDCVGRGLSAASVMGQLRSACRAVLLQSGDPADALTALDEFASFIPDALCSTVFCGVLDGATGELRYASAGHPPGILVHPYGMVELLEAGRSPALDLAPGQPRGQSTVRIPPGATLLLYTDGLAERRGDVLDAGIERAGALLSAQRGLPVDDLAERVITELAPAQGYEDDVAILLYAPPVPLDLAIPADPDELATVRRALRGWLSRLSLSTELAQDVLIASCEAVANAIEHGYRFAADGTVRLRAETRGYDLRIRVSDEGQWRPPHKVEHRGNGLRVIRAIMREVAVTTSERGTTVDMVVSASPRSPVPR